VLQVRNYSIAGFGECDSRLAAAIVMFLVLSRSREVLSTDTCNFFSNDVTQSIMEESHAEKTCRICSSFCSSCCPLTSCFAQTLGTEPMLNHAVQGQSGAQPEGALFNFVNWIGNVVARSTCAAAGGVRRKSSLTCPVEDLRDGCLQL